MKIELNYINNMHVTGKNESGIINNYDIHHDNKDTEFAPSPMETILESMGACSMMDVLGILRKKRKTIKNLKMDIDGTRAEEHPKVFTEVKLHYILWSPDAEEIDLVRAIELSQSTYCGVSAMFQRSGCKVTWTYEIIKD